LKVFHLEQFGRQLSKNGMSYKLIIDIDFLSKFFDIKNKVTNKKNFDSVLNEFKPDAVLLDRQSKLGIRVLQKKIPLFVILRGDVWQESKWAKETIYKSIHSRIAVWHKMLVIEKCFEGAKVILPLSHFLAKIVKDHYPDKTIEVLQISGRDPSFWHNVKGMNLKHPCVGLLQGAGIWGKTKEMLVLTKVLEAMPDVTFYWAGDGPYRDKILPILSKYDNFKWLGQLKYPDDVRKFLSEIDVYALVSGMESFGQTILEASLMEKPVVATKVGGIPELVKDGITGYLVPQGNPLELKERLADLLNDAKKAKQMGKEGRNFIKDNFSWEVIARKFVDILNTYR